MENERQGLVKIPGSYVAALFVSYLLAQLFVFPFLMTIFDYATTGVVPSEESVIEEYSQGWVQLSLMLFAATVVFFVFSLFRPYIRHVMWYPIPQIAKKRMRSLCMGVGCAVAIYPLILLLTAILNQILQWIFGGEPQEQDVVNFFRQTKAEPFLMGSLVMMIAVVIPIVEEILFRGGLQRWLMGFCSIRVSIVVSSVIFALFHFTIDQAMSNVSVMFSLFVLGCALGYLYYQCNSLWASIALHMTFNMISMMMILFVQGNWI